MLRSMYSSVAGLKAQQTKMDVIGNNIANVNTVGFKQGDVYFKEMINQDLGKPGGGSPFNREVGLGVTVGAIDTKFTQGALQSTGRNLDFALEGDGMFVIVPPSALPGGPTGAGIDYTDPNQTAELQYTREGIFSWDDEGYLRTIDGNYVLGQDGKPVSYSETAGNPAGAVPVESVLQVATFFNFAGLENQGSNNYKASTNSGSPLFGAPGTKVTDPTSGAELSLGKVRAGFVEMSNVDLASEFTNMIITSRAFQANSRTITTSDEMLQELVNLKR